VNKLSGKCTSWCLLDLSLVLHMTELAEWFDLCNSWHGMTSESLFAFREFFDLIS